MSTYAVTGCAGFVGSHLTEALLADGHEVVGIDAFTDYYDRERKEGNLRIAREHRGFRLQEVDLSIARLRPLVEEVDGVFHLAAQPGVRPSWHSAFPQYVQHNVLASQRLFAAAARAGRRVLLASSSSVYGITTSYPTRESDRTEPISPYGVTKLMCEKLAHAYAVEAGLDAVVLRYFTIYGPRQRPDMAFSRIIEALREGGVFRVFGTGSQSRDVTYVGDAVSASMAAFERARPGTILNVGGGTEVSLREVIEIAQGLSGRRLRTHSADHAAGDVHRTKADISRARAETGWIPQVSIHEGLAAQLAAPVAAPVSVTPPHSDAAAARTREPRAVIEIGLAAAPTLEAGATP